MGTAFDYFGLEAHPAQESFMVQTGKLSMQQVANRKLLRSVMRRAGFLGISSEWWHFNSCTRNQAKIWYSVIP
jgi:D-alanyl-D-alanine dipeptidase